MTLGEKLQMLRKSRALSQEQLAEELEVSRQAISKWECGDSVPDLDKLKSISRYFGVTTDYLIFEEQSGLQPEQAEKSLDVETCKKALLSLVRENIGRILCYAAAAYCFLMACFCCQRERGLLANWGFSCKDFWYRTFTFAFSS